MTHRIAVLPGDGIGPETIAETMRAIEVLAARFEFAFSATELPFGGAAIDLCGDPLPAGTLTGCRAADAVLKGAIGGPRWDHGEVRPEMGLLRIRAELAVFANVRPVRLYTRRLTSPLRPELVRDLDLVIVRELTGGLYFGPKELDAEHGLDTCAYTRQEVERVARRAFELARMRSGRLCSVDKQNVLSSSKLWRHVVSDLADDYPEVELSHQLVDSMAMKLIEQPAAYDVILTENMFGDILSDLAASVGGGVGLAPSSSVGAGRPGLYEAVHGSAPDIAGQGRANPAATMLSAAMMLRDLGEQAAADSLEHAIIRLLDEGPVTPDLGGTATTRQFGDAVCNAILATEVLPT
jgi:3-isopropylmalate dehydrogenase